MVKNFYPRALNKLRDASISIAHFLHRLTHDYSYVNLIMGKYHNNPGLKKDIFQRYKLWCLTQTLEQHKPQKILEFGSGSSTVVFGDYAAKNNATVISVENDPEWAERVKQFVAGNDHVKIITTTVTASPHATPQQLRYDINFEEEFDLVFIDGPGGYYEGMIRKKGATTNALDLNSPKLVLVDGRKATAEYMQEKMSGHRCDLSDLHSLRPVRPGYNYFSVFSRKQA